MPEQMPDNTIAGNLKDGLDTPDIFSSFMGDKQPEKEQVNLDSRVIHVKFTPEQQAELKDLIEKEVRRYKGILDAEGFYENVENCKEKFEAEHEGSSAISGDYDIRIPLQKLIVRTLTDRAIRQTFQADPLVLMEREGPISDDDLHIRQNKLDFVARNQVRYEELCRSIYEHAIYEPVCITETIHYYDVEENNTTIETYQPTPEDIERFDKDFGTVIDTESAEYQNRLMLIAGQSVTVPVTAPRVLYDGPKVNRIANDKFFADPKQKDFRKMRVHGKQVDFTWADIDMRANSKKYNWDKDAVERIKKMWGEDYKSKSIAFFEMIVLFDKNKDDKVRRYIITMEGRSREIVRSVLYTNEEMQYTAHSINPKDDSWIGESLLNMINELVAIVCSNFNYMLYSNDLAHTPIVASDDPDSITRKGIDLGVVNIIPSPKGTQFQQLTFGTTGFDRMAFISTLFDLIYLLAGVNVPALSGNTNAKDPRAGVGKTALTQQVTNLRIEDMITRLQYADVQVMEKIEKIMFNTAENLNYWNGGKEIEVKKTAYGSPVRYVMNGSRMTFNPSMDLDAIMRFLDICSNLSPATLGIEKVRRDILNIVIQDVGGSISKMKDKIMGYMDAAIKVKEIAAQAMQSGQAWQQGQQSMPDRPISELSVGAGGQSSPVSQSGMPDGGSGGGSGGTGSVAGGNAQ